MRKLLALLILLAAPAWAATYYVDCAADPGGDGTTQATTGEHCAWDTIADVNAASFSAGDSVLFKKGCTWRASLAPQWSGSAGSPITFSAYGTGDAPILDGSNLIAPGSSWTELAGTPVIAEQQTSGTTPVQTRIAAALNAGQGFKSDTGIEVPKIDVYIQKTGSPTGNIWLEIWATTGTPSRPTGGSAAATSDSINIATLSTSLTWVTFTFSSPPTLTGAADYWLILTGDWTNSDSVGAAWALNTSENYRGGDPYCRGRYSQAAPPVDVVFATHDYTFKIYKTAAGTIWTAAVTTEPKIVFFDGVMGTKVASQAACNSEGKWYWAANVLSVYSATDADTAYTSPGIEVGYQYACMFSGGYDYLTFDGIKFTKANASGLNLDSSTNITVQNCEVSYCSDFGVLFGTSSGDNLVDLCNIHHNGYGSDVGSGIFTWQDAGTSGHENYIKRNIIANNYSYGLNINSNYYIIEYNEVHDNGSTTAPYGANGIEIIDFNNVGYGQHHVIRYNLVYNQVSGAPDGTGICADDYARYVDIYGNVIYGCDGVGIGIWRAKDINVYGNTSYGNCDNFAALSQPAEIAVGASGGGEVSNVVIKNNIGQATETGSYAIRLDSNTYNSSGLSITNNCWYAAATNWYYWNASAGNNLATWNALTGVGTDLNSDPLMTDPGSDDFTLQAGSPCIDAGVNLGAIYLEQLLAGSTWPAAVETMDWHKTGGAPDLGAYGYRKLIW